MKGMRDAASLEINVESSIKLRVDVERKNLGNKIQKVHWPLNQKFNNIKI